MGDVSEVEIEYCRVQCPYCLRVWGCAKSAPPFCCIVCDGEIDPKKSRVKDGAGMSELKPCPFCGGEVFDCDVSQEPDLCKACNPDSPWWSWVIKCNSCLTEFNFGTANPFEYVNVWNCRVSDEKPISQDKGD